MRSSGPQAWVLVRLILGLVNDVQLAVWLRRRMLNWPYGSGVGCYGFGLIRSHSAVAHCIVLNKEYINYCLKMNYIANEIISMFEHWCLIVST